MSHLVLTNVFALSRNGKNTKSRFCDLDLSLMTLIFKRLLAVVKAHVQGKISSS